MYILLPYYRRGNLQDAINANLVDKKWFPERHILKLFKGVCEGLALIHGHRVKAPVVTAGPGNVRNMGEAQHPDDEEQEEGLMVGQVRDTTGGAVGELRPFAHRDLKPGMFEPHPDAFFF